MKKKQMQHSRYAISKKAIGSVIGALLILFVAVVAGTSGYNWYNGFITNYEAKKLQGYTTNIDESLKILSFKNESSSYILYFKNSLNGYIIVNEIELNGNNCTINRNNVIYENSITPLNLTCPLIVNLNNISVFTDVGIIETKKSLS